MERAKKKLSESEAFNKLSALCATAEYCCADIRKKMANWELPDGCEERIIRRLTEERYIDESRYARAYVNDKFRFAHWGRVKIKNMLYLQHIPEAEINEALSNIPQHEYEEVLKGVIESKQRTLPETESYEARTKIIRFAIQRGFELHEITKFIDES